MDRAEWARRLGVLVVTALVVAGGAAALPLLVQEAPGGPVDTSEWQAGADVQPLATNGTISPDVSGGGKTVVIDSSHGNRFSDAEIQPLVRALVREGYTVHISTARNLSTVLADADAFVVIDPASEYDQEDVEAIEQFTDRGGRLLVLAEPNRKTVTQTPFGFAVTTQRSRVGKLGRAYRVTVDTRYIWNQEHNDGSFKDPLVRPAKGSPLPEGTYALYTAAPLYAPGADRIAVTTPGAHLSSTDDAGRYAVAVRRGNALFVGDSSFLATGHARVGDNERLVAYLIEFLAGSDAAAPEDRQRAGDGAG